MSKDEGGGAAFPVTGYASCNGHTPPTDVVKMGCGGMTLRDWFAGRATEEDVAEHRTQEWVNANHYTEGYVRHTNTREQAKYAHADAMLAARGATP